MELLLKFWPYILIAVLAALLSALGFRMLSLERNIAVLHSEVAHERACEKPSNCLQKLTEYERDTAVSATKTLTEAAGKVGNATDAMNQRRAEIEAERLVSRARLDAKIRETEAKLAEAMSNDPECKAWSNAPVPCPVPDAGMLLHEDARHGIIDRSGAGAASGVPADPGAADHPAVSGPVERPASPGP